MPIPIVCEVLPKSVFADMRWIRPRTSLSTWGRPILLDFQRQYNRKPRRCHAMTVSGLTIIRQDAQSPHIRESNDQNIRSRRRRLTCLTDRRRTFNCCLRAMFSAANVARPMRKLKGTQEARAERSSMALPGRKERAYPIQTGSKASDVSQVTTRRTDYSVGTTPKRSSHFFRNDMSSFSTW